MNVTIIGAGNMGKGIGTRVVAGNHSLTIFDKDGTKAQQLASQLGNGVVGLTKAAALEYGDKNIRINSVGQGYIKTPLVTESLDEKALKELVNLHPFGRLGEASEIAQLVLWLSSSKSSFVTGSYYAIDGGYLAQ